MAKRRGLKGSESDHTDSMRLHLKAGLRSADESLELAERGKCMDALVEFGESSIRIGAATAARRYAYLTNELSDELETLRTKARNAGLSTVACFIDAERKSPGSIRLNGVRHKKKVRK